MTRDQAERTLRMIYGSGLPEAELDRMVRLFILDNLLEARREEVAR